MPTPFTHLAAAQQLLTDTRLPAPTRTALQAALSAFLLGSVAADARNTGSLKREDTHFYHYEHGFPQEPWRAMVEDYPPLLRPHSAEQRAFVAGYVAHLAMDVWWSKHMLAPYFGGGAWLTRPERFYYLHILLIHMDERDLATLAAWHYPQLAAAQPQAWLPFMTDAVLSDWRDLIAQQLAPQGSSKTLEVFGGRLGQTPAQLQAVLDDSARLQADLWQNIPPSLLATVEAEMYSHARQELQTYWLESASA